MGIESETQLNARLLHPGDRMPEFRGLRGVDGKLYSSSDFSNATVLVVVFSCNHCPYVQAYQERMMAFQRDYGGKGVQLVAINSNDETNYPDDSYDQMVERAKEQGFNFPYLRDPDQRAATAFGATHTPQFFAFDKDRTLRYSGKLDDNWQDPSAVKETYLRDAVDALLKGESVATAETFSIGCTIKWR
jgi:peroxiredoxin